jgi:imidazolonepropionase-like amidohydrolase
MSTSPRRTTLGTAIMLAMVPGPVAAQFRDVPLPPAYAVRGATVVRSDGSRDTSVTIVVRGRLIEAMGHNVTVPGDAKLLDGDSLYVYPGLVDAHGRADVAFPEIERSDSVRSWDAPRDLQGFLAHRRVVDYLELSSDGGKAQRTSGVVAAGVLPDRGLASGLGAAIVYRLHVHSAWELIANDNVGLAMAFQGGQGVYPSTLFGIIAYVRQAFEDARRDGLIQAAYTTDPTGMGVPSLDPDYAVLRRVMEGQTPVLYTADRAEDIRRVLRLATEFEFHPIIVGGGEAWRVAGELARRNIPVLIDGDFPKPDKWKPASADTIQEAPPSPADTVAGSVEPQHADLEPAAAREKERIENIRANAGRLARAGVRFAITSGGGDGNLLEAARLAIEYGLAEDVALRAITSVPAALLGMPNVSRIGPGLSATFIVTSGPIFDKDTKILHTFVEGGYEVGGEAGGGEAPTVVVSGGWTMTLSAGGQEFVMEAMLTMDPDGSFDGNVTNDQFGTAPMRGRVSGSRMTFTITLSFGGQQAELTGEGSVEGDRVSGNGESPFGAFSFTGTKKPGGAR